MSAPTITAGYCPAPRTNASGLQLVVVEFVVGFIHLDHCIMPDDPAPFIGFTDQLQSRLRMPRVSLDTQHFGDHTQLLAIVAHYQKIDCAPYRRQVALKM